VITDSPVCRWARATRARGWEWDPGKRKRKTTGAACVFRDPTPTLQPGLRPGRQRLTMSVSNVAGSVFLRVLRCSVMKSVSSIAWFPPDPQENLRNSD